ETFFTDEETPSEQNAFWSINLPLLSSRFTKELQNRPQEAVVEKRCRWKLCGTGRLRFI
ncbi:hypothetical protein Y032_0867g2769, partial [Ancylostoma ceylanicum]